MEVEHLRATLRGRIHSSTGAASQRRDPEFVPDRGWVGTQCRVEARPVWVNCGTTTGEAGAQKGGLASLLLLGAGGTFPEFVTIPERSRFSVLPRKLDPRSLKGLGGWRGQGSVSEEWGGSRCFGSGRGEERKGRQR